ncbi:putative damage-inducible protein DinB [Flavobacterium arsenatis]|uniref:Damage-inducible protein DinB n=1 Tax=Flavobacterium arsenatis TaxID=1484332 RepID=A0ABU1TNU1_9FLAO|nr:DinB family protein [Flavobacterium arsenatis]MDR6967533.1 putative damage-inducible protein DinB [Flavobacterium arsenatis]
MKVTQLHSDEYASFYANYIAQVSDEYTLMEELEISVHRLIKFVQDIPMDKYDYRYAERKWTIKDILQHLIDAERIFAYRALRFARNDKTELPGFEENNYADIANGDKRSIMDLLTELAVVRQSTLSLYKTFKEEQLLRSGIASNNNMSVRALGFVIIGHQNHHQKVFQERYL